MPKWKYLVSLATIMVSLLLSHRPAPADDAQVDLLLVLAADVSRSVDEQEYKLQREGYASAMTDPRVVKAMTGGPNGRIGICFVEWSAAYEQTVVIDWTVIGGDGDAQNVARRLREVPRSHASRTSISAAIDFSMALLTRSPFKTIRRIINVSGDGTNNTGRDVKQARDDAVAQGVTINGLVILSDVPLATNPEHTHPPGGLMAYYENNVIGGPGAFAVQAQNFESFGQALIGKLLKEIAEVHPRDRDSRIPHLR